MATGSDAALAVSFLLQRVQPAGTGLIDGSLSSLAPIFAVGLATPRPTALLVALATIAVELLTLTWIRSPVGPFGGV